MGIVTEDNDPNHKLGKQEDYMRNLLSERCKSLRGIFYENSLL
jgi:hypothetical protein